MSASFDSLWGDDFVIPDKKAEKAKVKKITEKIQKPKFIEYQASRKIMSLLLKIKKHFTII